MIYTIDKTLYGIVATSIFILTAAFGYKLDSNTATDIITSTSILFGFSTTSASILFGSKISKLFRKQIDPNLKTQTKMKTIINYYKIHYTFCLLTIVICIIKKSIEQGFLIEIRIIDVIAITIASVTFAITFSLVKTTIVMIYNETMIE